MEGDGERFMQITTRYRVNETLKFKYNNIIKSIKILFLATVILGTVVLSANNSKLATYKNLFFNEKYIEAKEYYEETYNSFVSRNLSFDGKVATFLNEQLDTTLEKFNKNEITNVLAMNVISEIKIYNLVNEEVLNNAVYKIQSTEALKEINSLLKENKDFENTLRVIEEREKQYPNLEGLSTARGQALNGIKFATLAEAKISFDEGKFDDAITKLENKSVYLEHDLEYNDTLNSYKAKKEEEIKKIEEEKKKAALAMVVNTTLKRGEFETAEEFINATNLSSSKPYLIYVDLQNQTTEIFKGSKGKWNLVYSFTSSTGKKNTPTPKGLYKVTGRGNWFFSGRFQQGAKWYVQFKGNYLFHSLPMDKSKNIVDSTLGTPSSHGCVRLEVDHAKWLYDNIPNGTTVFIK